MTHLKQKCRMLQSPSSKMLFLTILLLNNTLYGQISDLNTKFIQTNMLNKPFESYKNILGFELSLEKRLEYEPIFHSINMSMIGSFQNRYFDRTIINPQGTDVSINLAYSYYITSLMYGLVYYPIQKRAIFNPFGRAYAGIGGYGYNTMSNTGYYEFESYENTKRGSKLSACFSSRLNLGIEINLSHISPWDRESKFSIYFSTGLNYMTKVSIIDFSNLQGNNLITGTIVDEANNTKHIIDVGNLHQFSPIYLTYEFGFIWRLLNY